MRDLSRLKPEDILSLGEGEPERLFSLDPRKARDEYGQLAKIWHPDVCSNDLASEVFTRIVALYSSADSKREDGTWEVVGETIELEQAGVKAFRTADGSIRRIDYIICRPFELGKTYIGDYHVTYILEKEYGDLYDSAIRRMRRFSYKDDRMKKEVSRYLPSIQDTFEGSKFLGVTLRKTPDCLCLRDVLTYMGGKIDPQGHIGWMLNVLYGLTCYLQIYGITHNDISLDSYFVSPEFHSGVLLGGWWYTMDRGKPMLALPDRTFDFIPPDILRHKTGGYRTDLELIRALGRELLGDSSGHKLRFDKDVPKVLSSFLNLPSAGNALQDYRDYKFKVLEKCWPKKFLKLDLKSQDLYARR